ncbi:MAG: Gfo/Idh/MocA family oxidoreductase [Ruminococcaceae bacterium]|nr:Gfo/Idh/MocA family oxidoreductase [Oscillospiraceae bacterium]
MKIKWGVIGCGGIADRRTLPGMMLAENAELVAVMDTNSELAQAAKEKYHAQYAFTTVEDLLALDEIQAVYIASPVAFHQAQTEAAAKAGKHILLEKPMTLSSAKSQEIADVCEKYNVKIGVGLMMRFHTYHQLMKKLIEEGKLGQIVSMRAQLTCWYPDIPGNWRQQKATAGGGSLMDMGIHCVDLLQYISGLKAVEVASMSGTQIFNYDVEDGGSLIMKMENGAIAYVDANFNIPDDAAVCKLEIYGTEGSIFAEGTIGQVEGGNVRVTICGDQGAYDAAQNRQPTNSYMMEAELGNMYTKEIEGFGKAISEGKVPPVTADDAINVQKIIEAAYASNDSKKFISI